MCHQWDQFEIVVAVLTSDWCQKAFVFFCAIRGQQTLESFRVQAKYIKFSCSSCLSWLFAEALCTRWKIQYQNKMQGKTFGKYAGPFARIVIKSSVFDSWRNIHRSVLNRCSLDARWYKPKFLESLSTRWTWVRVVFYSAIASLFSWFLGSRTCWDWNFGNLERFSVARAGNYVLVCQPETYLRDFISVQK